MPWRSLRSFMKKLLGFIFVIVAIISGAYVGMHRVSSAPPTPTLPQQVQSGKQSPIVQSATTKKPGLPQKLIIPRINVDASVESVGLDSQKRMDVPKHAADVGWYNLGFKPGEEGSAVMDGHLDDTTGAPAVFWNLKKLKIGDRIQVVDDKGTTFTYKITNVQTFPFDKVPLQQVFASTDKARLNLITCGGTWDQANKNYTNRTVVYSELVQ